MRSSRLVASGCALIVIGSLGFLTLADDLRHVGEVFGVLAVLACGVCLLLAGLRPGWSTILALQWAPVGIVAGTLAGAATDQVALGGFLGCALGIGVARLRRAPAA